jgi:hypothetical protein
MSVPTRSTSKSSTISLDALSFSQAPSHQPKPAYGADAINRAALDLLAWRLAIRWRVARIHGLARTRSATARKDLGHCGFEFADYFHLILIDQDMVDHRGFACVVIIDTNASARFD